MTILVAAIGGLYIKVRLYTTVLVHASKLPISFAKACPASGLITPCISIECNSFGIVCLSVCVHLILMGIMVGPHSKLECCVISCPLGTVY